MGDKDILLEEVVSGSFLMINRKLIQKWGLIKAGFLSDLINKRKLLRGENKLLEGEWFFYRVRDIQDYLKIGDFQQRTLIKEFKEEGFLETKKLANTTSHLTYYKLNSEKILEFLSKE